jgi:YHS domain-containing protein
MKNSLTDYCPVCGMKVESAQYTTQYHKMYFHFCSQQCQERFAAMPQIYATSTAARREPLLKHRKLYLADPVDPAMTAAIEGHLLEMMGVTEARLQGRALYITYDLLQVTLARMEAALGEWRVEIDNGWWQRLRRALVHNSEENELSNLVHVSGACCNRPPPRP